MISRNVFESYPRKRKIWAIAVDHRVILLVSVLVFTAWFPVRFPRNWGEYKTAWFPRFGLFPRWLVALDS